jgi:5'-nucleotidase
MKTNARTFTGVTFVASTLAAISGCGVAPATHHELSSEAADAKAASHEWGTAESALSFHDHDAFTVSGCSHDDEHERDPKTRERATRPLTWHSQKPEHRGHKTDKVRLLGFNDFHGQLSQGRLVGGRPVGGAAVLGSYLVNAAAEVDDRALIVHAGDHVGASPPASALLQDEPSIQFLNLLANRDCRGSRRENLRCNVVGTLGNHEFDEGASEMLRLVHGGNSPLGPFLQAPYRGASFNYVSANVLDAATHRPLLAPYTIKHVGRVKVGVIGAVLQDTPSIVTPTGVAGLEFVDEATAINTAVRQLRREGVHTIVVTIHQGGAQTSYEGETVADGQVTGDILPIIEQLHDDVDVVISGHRHAFTNALVTNANGTPILVTQAFSASTAYAEIDLEVSKQCGDVLSKTARVITTYSDVAPGNVLHPSVAELVKQAEDRTAPLVNRVVGESAVAVDRTQTAAGESALGNLIADAQRTATGSDFAFMNPGGIRADLDQGPITWGDLFTIQPFGNSLVRMDLTGAQIRTLLEQQWVGQTSARLLQVSGLRYTWDAAAANGSKVVELSKDGVPLDLGATYSVTVNSFIAAGGDNFTVLIDGTNRVGGDIDLDALIAHVESLPQPITVSVENRITRAN